jgi:hypothetical protein
LIASVVSADKNFVVMFFEDKQEAIDWVIAYEMER